MDSFFLQPGILFSKERINIKNPFFRTAFCYLKLIDAPCPRENSYRQKPNKQINKQINEKVKNEF